MVSERERGVWRRFRLTPASTFRLVATTAVARYLLLLIAAALQLILAVGVFGMPIPEHPIDLALAFTLVAFAFIGLGLVIAMVADNVPAVQALGQCIFLPMLVIGGVAVRIETLPAWAQHLSAYFPGRYAVAAMQVSAIGDGLRSAGFAVLALILIGTAGCLAGAMLFRWDQQQRFMRLERKGWVVAALGAWILVGAMAQATGQVAVGVPPEANRETLLSILDPRPLPEEAAGAAPDTSAVARPAGQPVSLDTLPSAQTGSADTAASPGAEDLDPTPAAEPQPWQEVDPALLQMVDYGSLPSDRDVVAPVAGLGDEVFPETLEQLECVQSRLRDWQPGRIADPVQRTRNLLYIAAVTDIAQLAELERHVPLVVYDHLEATFRPDDLQKILYWVAAHPEEGDDLAAGRLTEACIELPAPGNPYALRARTQIYALKLLGRLIGVIPRG
jgi:hypothetical protein